MTLHKFIIPPDQTSYSFMDANDIIAVKLDGGASKFRKDILDANLNLTVQWTLTKDQYNYFRTFYRIFTENGSLPFLIDLYVDDPFILSEHEVHFLPGTVGLRNQHGESFIVGATLEVTPVAQSQVNIDSASLYASFGEAFEAYNDIFDNLINVEVPADYP